jgi:hypothetical protein
MFNLGTMSTVTPAKTTTDNAVQMSSHPSDGFTATSDKSILTFQGKQTTIVYDKISSLPILYTASGVSTFRRFCANQHYLQQAPNNNPIITASPNLTPQQQCKLHLHERCAHANWDQINTWIRSARLPGGSSLASEPDLTCAACQFFKAHKRSHKSDTGHISANHLAPGDGVSSDGMEAGCPGRMMMTHGLPLSWRYKNVSFWKDHFSQFVYVTMHETKKVEELLRSKLEFEEYSAHFSINIKNIRADNGVYTAKIIQDSCWKKQQNLSFCTVGAHWENGIAKSFISSIIQHSRTILLHAMAKWPNVITKDPFTTPVYDEVNNPPHTTCLLAKMPRGLCRIFALLDAPYTSFTSGYRTEIK